MQVVWLETWLDPCHPPSLWTNCYPQEHVLYQGVWGNTFISSDIFKLKTKHKKNSVYLPLSLVWVTRKCKDQDTEFNIFQSVREERKGTAEARAVLHSPTSLCSVLVFITHNVMEGSMQNCMPPSTVMFSQAFNLLEKWERVSSGKSNTAQS